MHAWEPIRALRRCVLPALPARRTAEADAEAELARMDRVRKSNEDMTRTLKEQIAEKRRKDRQ